MATVQVPSEKTQARPILTTIALLALVVCGVIGADPDHVRERFVDHIVPGSETAALPEAGWTGVVTLRGTGTTTAAPFTVDRAAVRWRVKWSCSSRGHLSVQAAGHPLAVIDALCPGSGVGFANQAGTQRLEVTTDGPWQLEVEQQVPGRPGRPPM